MRFIHKIGSYIKINIIHKIGSYIKINIIHKIGSYIKINIKKMRFIHKMGPLKVLNNHLINYPTPMNLSYAYNFGSLAGILLASQIITGILLAMHYVGHVDLAFNSVVHLMNDVPSGMILRYAHANGASLFFTVVYIHILRGVYYSSGNQPREAVWITGVVILLVMVLTAFIG
jgi:ubiquinol-cytochrome c reductase cytochrome b subunit